MSEELENNESQEAQINLDGNAENDQPTSTLNFEITEEEIQINTIELLREKYRTVGEIAIRPYVNPKAENMGLERHGYVVHPGTHQVVDMACVMRRGKKRYLNGLDEFAPSVKALPEEQRLARIKEIRTIVSQLELENNYHTINIEDPEFWDKVIDFRPDNSEIWGKMSLKCSNGEVRLNPVKNTEHLLMILAIEAGGYPDIAASLEDVKSQSRPRKWFLDKQSDTVGKRASSGKTKNKALAKLEIISESNDRQLFYIAKLLYKNSIRYKNSTLKSVIYDDLDNYINGYGPEDSIKRAANQFMTYAGLDMKELKVKAVIKDATFNSFFISKGDGLIYTADEGIMLGRNVSEVYEKLNNPANNDLLLSLVAKVEKTW